MHAEWGRIDAATAERLNAVRAAGGRLIAVGTTSLRLLESAADEDGTIRPFEGDTAIFITPGYRFKAIDGLITNFHLPRSTLFMLVSALMGLEVMKSAYAHAIARRLPLLLLWRREFTLTRLLLETLGALIAMLAKILPLGSIELCLMFSAEQDEIPTDPRHSAWAAVFWRNCPPAG